MVCTKGVSGDHHCYNVAVSVPIKQVKYKHAIVLPTKLKPRAAQEAKLATLNSISPPMKAGDRTMNVNETCQSPYSYFQSAIHGKRWKRKVLWL